MAVYVDDIMTCVPTANWRWSKSCHLIADTLEELHAFAKQIGMRRAWFQNDSRLPHYDLTENRRRMAVRLGAIELDRRGFVSKMREIQSSAQQLAAATGIPASVLNSGYDQTQPME